MRAVAVQTMPYIGVPLLCLAVILLLWIVISPNGSSERNETIRTLAQVIGGGALLAGLYFTYKSIENSRLILEHQQKNQEDDRFIKAAELLSNADSEDAHIGALFMLEQLANESVDHYLQVIELICSFIRRRSEQCRPPLDTLGDLDPNNLPRAPHDLDVAIRVLGRRKQRFGDREQQYLDLRGANFCGLYIPDADFAMAVLSNALLIDTHFLRGNLAGANVINADFRHATFDRVLMADAHLEGGRGENAELLYNSVLADPSHLIPTDIGKGDNHHWVRKPPKKALVRVQTSLRASW